VVEAATAATESNAATSAVSAASETVREATPETVRGATSEVGQVATKTVGAIDDQTLQPAGTRSIGVPSSPGESPVSESPVSRDNASSTYGAAQPVGVLPRVHVGGVSSSSARYSGYSSAGPSWLGALEGLDGAQSTPMSGPTGTRSNDPVPLDGPMPAPGSSGVAAGSTGSFFAPIAALLALLALVAPAVLRRLGEVPDCRPPIPFVCALERPG
jgi:hypothetical protein